MNKKIYIYIIIYTYINLYLYDHYTSKIMDYIYMIINIYQPIHYFQEPLFSSFIIILNLDLSGTIKINKLSSRR